MGHKYDPLIIGADGKPDVREYLTRRGLSYSSLKEFRRSPRHYIHYLQKPRIQTEAMALGSLTDCLLLTPELFEKQFYLIQKMDRRTKAGKENWDIAIGQAGRRTIIDTATMDLARTLVKAVMDKDEARLFVENRIRSQYRLKWKDFKTGLPVNGALDFDTKVGGELFIVDFKTGQSSDPDEFARQAEQFDYLLQCGTYLEGYKRTRFQFPGFIFLVVEKTEPHLVTLQYCENKYIEEAKAEFRGTLNAFKMCLDHDLWDQGYEFRLLGTQDYFPMRLVGYHKRRFLGYETEEEER